MCTRLFELVRVYCTWYDFIHVYIIHVCTCTCTIVPHLFAFAVEDCHSICCEEGKRDQPLSLSLSLSLPPSLSLSLSLFLSLSLSLSTDSLPLSDKPVLGMWSTCSPVEEVEGQVSSSPWLSNENNFFPVNVSIASQLSCLVARE